MVLEKIRTAFNVSEKLTDVNNALEQQHTTIQELSKEIQTLKETILSVATYHKNTITDLTSLLEEAKTKLRSIGEAQKTLEEETYQFRMLKSQLQQKIMDKFDQELKTELKRTTDDLQLQAQTYTSVKEDMHHTAQTLAQLSQEIQKWLTISKTIRSQDFEMTKTTQQFRTLYDEKQELIRKIDMLERLVGKFRRTTRHEHL